MARVRVRRSYAVAFLVTFFFGPLGTLYVGWRTFLAFMVLLLLPFLIYGGFLTFEALSSSVAASPSSFVFVAETIPHRYLVNRSFGAGHGFFIRVPELICYWLVLLYVSSIVVAQAFVNRHNRGLDEDGHFHSPYHQDIRYT